MRTAAAAGSTDHVEAVAEADLDGDGDDEPRRDASDFSRCGEVICPKLLAVNFFRTKFYLRSRRDNCSNYLFAYDDRFSLSWDAYDASRGEIFVQNYTRFCLRGENILSKKYFAVDIDISSSSLGLIR